MRGVIKKKKKSVFARIVGKIWTAISPCEQASVTSDVPFDDVRISKEDVIAIATRRGELRTSVHSNSDAMVTFDGHN